MKRPVKRPSPMPLGLLLDGGFEVAQMDYRRILGQLPPKGGK